MGKDYLVEGARLMCINGGDVRPLLVPVGHGYTSDFKKKANCGDCKACINIPYFGTCKKNEKTHTCEGYMLLADKWESISVGEKMPEMVNGKEAITMDSVLICKKGGLIIPLSSGQGYEEKIAWEALMLRLQKIFMWLAGKNMLCHIFGKDPINMNTGNYIYEKEDLVVEGISKLSFKLFYNTMEKEKGGCLGAGWHHNHEVNIKKEKLNILVLCLEDGREVPFQKILGDVYKSVYGDRGLLKKEREGFCYNERNGEAYFFNEEGFLIEKKNRNGIKDNYRYNKDGQLEEVVGGNGGRLKYFYNKEKKLIRVKDHTGRMVQLWYRFGKLYKYINPMGNIYFYEYNENLKLQSITTPRGIKGILNEYDGANRVIKQTLADGSVTNFRYDDKKNCTYMLEDNGNLIIYESDERFRNIRTIYEDGEEIYEYNEKNQKTLYVDKNGYKTRYWYDEKGNLSAVENALGQKTKIQCIEDGQLAKLELADGTIFQNFYDKKGNLVERKDPLGNTILYEYNERGQPVNITKADGSCISVTYDSRGNMECIIDAKGNKIKFTYDDLNRITSIIDRNGNMSIYKYNYMNDLIECVNSLGDKRIFGYSDSGKLEVFTDFDVFTEKKSYDKLNRVKEIQDKEGNCTSYVYNKMGDIIEENLPNGGKRCYQYDQFRHMTSYCDELGNKAEFSYDAKGNITRTKNPDGTEIFYYYDALDRLKTVVESDHYETNFTYNLRGQIEKITRPGEITEAMEYDACGRVIKKKDLFGRILYYKYNSMGLPIYKENELGGKTVYSYYPGGLLKKVDYHDGTFQEFFYDANENLIELKNQAGYHHYYTYDGLNRIVQVCSDIGESISQSYDPVGNVTSRTDGKGNIRKYLYSPNGNMTEVIDSLGNRSIYSYDKMDRLLSIEQEDNENIDWGDFAEVIRFNSEQKKRHITIYERDLAGQLKSVTDALGNKELFTYDSSGRVKEQIDKEGNKTSYFYNSSGDLAQIAYDDGRKVEYEYNSFRQLKYMKDWLGVTTIESDNYGRVIQIKDHNDQTTEYEYGALGERKAIVYPDGERVEYNYDMYLRPSQVCFDKTNIKFSYNSNGKIEEKIFPGGMRSCYLYDKVGRITNITNWNCEEIIDEITYTYDSLGNKATMEKQRRGISSLCGSYQYHYDGENRLTEVKKNQVQLRKYAYDGFGNRVYSEKDGAATIFNYNECNQLVRASGEVEETYTYDRRGNLSHLYLNEKLVFWYEYDITNRIAYAEQEGGRYSKYEYNGLGQRVMKAMGKKANRKDNDFVTKDYIVDLTVGYNNVLQEKSENSVQKYIWSNGLVAAQDKGENRFYFTDDLGSPMSFLYDNGKMSELYDYDEFGNLLYGDWEGEQPFGFTGYQKDDVSGCYFAQAREYVPQTGRFMEEDPFEGNTVVPISLNRYSYCYQNPLRYWDPLGYVTSAEGQEAHTMLQLVYGIMHKDNGAVERRVFNYAYSETGVGQIDIYLYPNSQGLAEVYEIKPISHYANPNSWKGITGEQQRKGYIEALELEGIGVDPSGNTFDPNGMMLPSFMHFDRYIKYYTFPDKPGMIYWGYVNKPIKAKEEKKTKENALEDKTVEQIEEAGEWAAIVGGISAILYFLWEMLQNAVRFASQFASINLGLQCDATR